MLHALRAVADRWITRRATPDPQALAAVKSLMPAVVVTGGSRGIGRALAVQFAQDRSAVLLVAREAGPLEAAALEISRITGARTIALALDVTQPDAAQRIDAALADAGLYADVLVNNAGVGLSGAFAEQSGEDVEGLIALNITAATRLMHHALPPMLARGRGGIMNITSLGGLVPGPYQAAYYASKAYLTSLTEAAAFEARGRGVRIMAVAPGPVDTRFHRAMQADDALYRTVLPSLSAEAVARSAYRGFMLGRTVVVPGLLPTIAAVSVKLLPHLLTVPIVGALLGAPTPPGTPK